MITETFRRLAASINGLIAAQTLERHDRLARGLAATGVRVERDALTRKITAVNGKPWKEPPRAA
jgi:hypothetical protein